MSKYDFSLDLPIAQKTEQQVTKFLLNKFHNLEFVENCNNADFDLRFAYYFTVEVKEDFACQETGNVGIEYSCRGKDSGIAKTKADYFLYKIHEPDGTNSLYWIKTKKLKKMINDKMYHLKVDGGDSGSNSKCYLFYLSTIKENWNYLGKVD